MLPSDALPMFSDDYFQARDRFTEMANQSASRQSSHVLDVCGPNNERLTVDVARLGKPDASRVIFISSGLHGVEGYFGSAVQLMLMESIRRETIALSSDTAMVFAHALNPYGFAHRRACRRTERGPQSELSTAAGNVLKGRPMAIAASTQY